MDCRSLHQAGDFSLIKKPILQTVLFLGLLLHSALGWGQMVLTSEGSSIIKISGLPVAGCNGSVAIHKYSATPQNYPTLASQVEESLAAIAPENRIRLEAGKTYRYSFELSTPEGTTVHPALLGLTLGAATSILPVYSATDGIFPPPAKAAFLQSAVHPSRASGNIKFDGILQFTKAGPNGFLCIPFREKSKNNTIQTTNIIIPFMVGEAAATATEKSNKQPATTSARSTPDDSRPRAVKRGPENLPGQPTPIIGVAAHVQAVRQHVKPDAGLKVRGKAILLNYSRVCPLEAEKPEEVQPDLNLKLYPNPTNAATNVQYYLQESQEVTVVIYDLQGKAVHQLLPKTTQAAGLHQLQWHAADIPSGMYAVRVQTKTGFGIQKILVTHDVHR